MGSIWAAGRRRVERGRGADTDLITAGTEKVEESAAADAGTFYLTLLLTLLGPQCWPGGAGRLADGRVAVVLAVHVHDLVLRGGLDR